MSSNSQSNRRVCPTVVGLAAGALLLAACGSIIPGADRAPPKLYDLTPKSTFAPRLPRVRAQIVIETPVAAASLTSKRIAVKRTATTLDYYANSEWTDLAPNMVQTLLVESFENSKKITSVGREGTGLSADYVLKPELREFQAVLHGKNSPKVRVRINVKLVRMPQRIIVAGTTFESIMPAKGSKINTIVETFDDALGKVLKRIVEWTLRKAARDSRLRKFDRG